MLMFRTQNISKKNSQANQIHAVVLYFLRPVVVSLYGVIESKQYGQNEITEFDNKMYFQWLHKNKVFHQFLFHHTFLPCY